MPGEEDLETIHRIYAEWSRGEYWNDEHYDPEIVFVLGDGFPDPGVYRGIEEMGRGFRGWLESWRDLRFELEEVIPRGGLILAFFHLTATGRSSGIPGDVHGGHIWTMRDGRALRIEVHLSREAALAAAESRD